MKARQICCMLNEGTSDLLHAMSVCTDLVTPCAPPNLPLCPWPRHPDIDDARPWVTAVGGGFAPSCVAGGAGKLTVGVLRNQSLLAACRRPRTGQQVEHKMHTHTYTHCQQHDGHKNARTQQQGGLLKGGRTQNNKLGTKMHTHCQQYDGLKNARTKQQGGLPRGSRAQDSKMGKNMHMLSTYRLEPFLQACSLCA
eukprot:1159402-Pelagomonas_calceolata.AAC.9